MNMLPSTQFRNKNRHKIFAEYTSDIISTITPQGVFTYVSPSIQSILGLDPATLVGNHLYNYIHPDDIDIFTKHQLQILEDQRHTSLVYRFMNHNNQYVWLETRVQLIHDAKTGVVKELVLISVNANDKILREEKIKQTESILSETQTLAKIGSWNYNPTNEEVFWSSGMRAIYKVSNEFVPSIKAYTTMIHPEDKEQVMKNLLNSKKTGEPITEEYRIFRSDLKIRHIKSITRFALDKTGNVTRIYGIIQDITESKIAEEQLHKLIIEGTGYKNAIYEAAIIAITDTRGKIVQVNDNFCKISKYSKEELIGQDHRIINSGYHTKDFWKSMWQTISSGKIWKGEVKNKAKDGSMYWVESTIVPFLDENKKPFQYLSIRNDITDRKKAEERLEQNISELESRVDLRTLELNSKNKAITDSISYAKRLQIALLPRHDELKTMFKESFIFSRPKDIVSGDFFWCYKKRNKMIIALVDCTGHGVPGALMSIIGNNLLTKIIVDNHFENPSEILELLDYNLKNTISTGPITVNDGMDIAICVIDTYFSELYFAGAVRPLFYTNKENGIEELKGCQFPIGGAHDPNTKKFETTRIPLFKGQRIYMSSDGYYSQFGGFKGKKLMKSHFKKILHEVQEHDMEMQKQLLRETFAEWSGNHEQVDDVMVVGFEI